MMPFEECLCILESEFKKRDGDLVIPGGKNGYKITAVDLDHAVTITQGSTKQVHLNQYLKYLYEGKNIVTPKNNKFSRDSKYGHLRMMNAIVDYLKSFSNRQRNKNI